VGSLSESRILENDTNVFLQVSFFEFSPGRNRSPPEFLQVLASISFSLPSFLGLCILLENVTLS
jgi:hypothetical protein